MSIATPEHVQEAPTNPRNQVDDLLNQEFGEETNQIEEEEPQEIEGEEEFLEEEIPEEQDQEVEEEGEDDILSDLSDVAKHLGVEAEEMYAVEIPMADGEPPLTISALKDEVRQHRMERQQLMQQQQHLQQQQEQFDLLRNNPGAQYNEELMQTQGAIEAIEAQYKAIDWANVEDAGQAALYRQQLQEAKDAALNKRHTILEGMQQKQQQAYIQQKNQDWSVLVNVIPEWQQKDVFVKDRAEMSKIAYTYGIAEQEMQEISDPRFNKLLYDYTKLLAKTDTAVTQAKQVRKRGVKIRSRGAQRVAKKQNAAVESKIQRAKKTGNRRDQVAAVEALIS